MTISPTGMAMPGARYYSSDIARWLSVDPLAACPFGNKYPGWSPYSYTLNNPLKYVDPDGQDIIIVNSPKGANGMGHTAVLIGNNKTGYQYFSKDGTDQSKTSNPIWGPSNFDKDRTFSSLSEFSEIVNGERGDKPYTDAFQISTDTETDALMIDAAIQSGSSDYSLIGSSCIGLVSDALSAGGLNPGTETTMVSTGSTVVPQTSKSPYPYKRYSAITSNNKGKNVSDQLKKKDEEDEK